MPIRPRQPLPDQLKAGAFTVEQGRALGLSTKRMRGRDLDRPFRGVRVVGDCGPGDDGFFRSLGLPAPPPDLSARCAALSVALGAEPIFSHLTAAQLWPVPLPRLDLEAIAILHVCVRPPARQPRREGVRGHKLVDTRAFAVSRHGLRIIDPATMFCQLSAVLSVDDLVVVGDALIYAPRFPHPYDDRPWLTRRELTERVEAFRGRGKVVASRAVKLVRLGVESRPETLLRLAIVAAGLPEPEVNPDILGSAGRAIGRADLVYRRFRVIVEYDGDHHRTDTRQYDKDVHRLERFAEQGWVVVRITGRAFFRDRANCLLRIEHALSSAGWSR